MNDTGQKLADAGAPFAWLAWLFSHITNINEVLQTFALISAIVASVAAALYHFKKWRGK